VVDRVSVDGIVVYIADVDVNGDDCVVVVVFVYIVVGVVRCIVAVVAVVVVVVVVVAVGVTACFVDIHGCVGVRFDNVVVIVSGVVAVVFVLLLVLWV